MRNIFTSKMNKCVIAIPMVYINNHCQTFPGKTFETKGTFIKKLCCIQTLMHCKARDVYRHLFSPNQGNGSKMAFVAESYNPKKFENLAITGWLDVGNNPKASII